MSEITDKLQAMVQAMAREAAESLDTAKTINDLEKTIRLAKAAQAAAKETMRVAEAGINAASVRYEADRQAIPSHRLN